MLKEGRDGRDASIKRIVSAQRPVSGLPGRECAPLDLPFLFLRNCKQLSYYTKFPASLQGVPAGPFARGLRPPFLSLPRGWVGTHSFLARGAAPLRFPKWGLRPHSPRERALRPAPRPTFSRRESRQRYARDRLVPGPPAKGALPPLIPRPPALAVLVAGKKARGILRGNPAAPRIDSRKCELQYSLGRNQGRFTHKLKVANRSRLVAEGSPARAGAQRSERSKGGDSALGDSKGRSPWRFFGDFLIGEKVTRGQGGAPASGGVQRGAAPRMVGAGTMSLQNPPGRGAERPHLGRSAEEGPGPPRKEASECPSAKRKRGKEKGPHQRGPLKI